MQTAIEAWSRVPTAPGARWAGLRPREGKDCSALVYVKHDVFTPWSLRGGRHRMLDSKSCLLSVVARVLVAVAVLCGARCD
jgi:hypothetical protein